VSFSLPVPSKDGKQIFAGGYLDRGELMRYDRRMRTWVPYVSGMSAADAFLLRASVIAGNSVEGPWIANGAVPVREKDHDKE